MLNICLKPFFGASSSGRDIDHCIAISKFSILHFQRVMGTRLDVLEIMFTAEEKLGQVVA
jgi:hypothetical protein